MTAGNQAYDPERIKHYARRGVRELFFFGGNERQSFWWLYESGGKITARVRDVFDWGNDEVDDFSVLLDPETYLAGLVAAREGSSTRLPSDAFTIDGQTYLILSYESMSVDTKSIHLRRRRIDFDQLFLDSFSIIENSEKRLRTSRDLSLGPAELAIVRMVQNNPTLVTEFSPRAFEALVGSFLTHIGFSRVRLSRFVKDGGYDLWAVYCEGDDEYVVVVEVKHFGRRKVGLEIVDRLNGVRDREDADKGAVVTSSGFSADALKRYRAKSDRMALIDFERLIGLIAEHEGRWIRTPSSLWSLPASQEELE